MGIPCIDLVVITSGLILIHIQTWGRPSQGTKEQLGVLGRKQNDLSYPVSDLLHVSGRINL